MYPPRTSCPDLRILPRALVWSKDHMGEKKGRGDLDAFRLYLDDLRASQVVWDPWARAGAEPEYLARSRAVTASRVLLESAFGWQWYLGDRVTRQSLGLPRFQVPGPLPPRASHTGQYTLAELEEFTRPATDLARFLPPERDYAAYQREHLAGPLGVRAFTEVQSQARAAAEKRRAAGERRRVGGDRPRLRLGAPVEGGPPVLSWELAVTDAEGDAAVVRFAPARADPPLVTVSVPAEWVNEMLRLKLAMEKVIKSVAGGTPLELHYPTPAQPLAQPPATRRPQAHGTVVPRRKTARPPPQARPQTTTRATQATSTTPAVTQRQASATRPAAGSAQRVPAGVTRVASEEERLRWKLRSRQPTPSPASKKRRVEAISVLESTSEEEGDGDEERSSTSSGSDDTADDPPFRRDLREEKEDDDDDEDLEEWLKD